MNFSPDCTEVSFSGSFGASFSSSGLVLGSLEQGIGTICFGLAVIIGIAIVLLKFQQAKTADLRNNGNPVTATVQSIEERTRSSFSGTGVDQIRTTSDYYVVLVTWTDPQTGAHRTFTSDEQSARPRCEVGDEVTVFVDPTNPTRYHVEI